MVSWKDQAKKHRAEWCADKHPTLCTAETFQRRDLPPVMMSQQTPTSTNKIIKNILSRMTQTRSHFSWILPHFSVICTQLAQIQKT